MLAATDVRSDRLVAVGELAAVLALVELQLWWLSGIEAPTLSLLNVVLIVGIVWRSWRHSSVPCPMAAKANSSWAMVAVATGLLSLAVLALAWLCGYWPLDVVSEVGQKSATVWAVRKSVTVLVQQLALHLFLVPVCYRIFRSWKPAILTTAVIFALLHLPNPWLVLLTAVAGLTWILLYQSTGRILPLVCSHLLLAVLARETFHESIYNMRVGADALPLLPFHVAADDGRQFRVFPDQMMGTAAVRGSKPGHVILGGWAADLKFGMPADQIYVLAAGELLIFESEQHDRPDVVDAYGVPGTANSGYLVPVPLELLLRDRHPRVFAVRGERISELAYQPKFEQLLAAKCQEVKAALAAKESQKLR